MLRIQKGPPPACIAELHRTPGATWQSVSGEQKDAMRRALLAEQGNLCAYCMGRITNDRARCTVEHWRPRSDPGTDPFHWPDLLAVCDGGSGRPRTEQHCDTYRGDATLTLHPAHPGQDVEEQVHYILDGRLECADADALHLNYWRLRENRRKIQDAVTALCSGRDATGVRKLLTMWTDRDEQGRRRAYAGVAVELLRRRLDHLEKKSKRTRGNRDR